MFAALGLDQRNAIVLRCKTEFTEEETTEFFKRLQEEIAVPTWLPRRPLICQTIADLSSDELDEMFGVGQNEIQFWEHFLKMLCERDARIHPAFDAGTIENILIQLSRLTRSRQGNVGPITLNGVQAAFEAVVGQAPVEDAAVMLQRLPALGRVRAESNDRQFIDTYILDGLRAKDVASAMQAGAGEIIRRALIAMRFGNPLEDLGQRILAAQMDDRIQEFVQFAQRCLAGKNKILGCDIVASALRTGLESFDFRGLTIEDGHFIRFDMSQTLPLTLQITNSVFGVIKLPSAPPPQTSISNCLAERVFGVSSANALPGWIKKLAVDKFDSVECVSRIRQIGLDPQHEILAAIIRKTFFQKGAGRKEEALTRGLGRVGTQAMISRILNLLLKNGVLSRFRGDEGWVYTPNRSLAGRMKQMLYELTVSKDPIWIEVVSL